VTITKKTATFLGEALLIVTVKTFSPIQISNITSLINKTIKTGTIGFNSLTNLKGEAWGIRDSLFKNNSNNMADFKIKTTNLTSSNFDHNSNSKITKSSFSNNNSSNRKTNSTLLNREGNVSSLTHLNINNSCRKSSVSSF
jgi:hypothetical protein